MSSIIFTKSSLQNDGVTLKNHQYEYFYMYFECLWHIHTVCEPKENNGKTVDFFTQGKKEFTCIIKLCTQKVPECLIQLDIPLPRKHSYMPSLNNLRTEQSTLPSKDGICFQWHQSL